MSDSTARILIETLVNKALRDIKESPKRSTRNLVDMAAYFSRGRFQQDFFDIAQTMLQNEDCPYYKVVSYTVNHVPSKVLLQFGMNVGYWGCTVGAKTIRAIEETENYNIPWTIALRMSTAMPSHYINRYQEIITEGEKLGIHNWMLFVDGQPQWVLPLAQSHPESAFCIFCEPSHIGMTFLDCASEMTNIMVVLRMNNDTPEACALLQEAEILYSVYHNYCEKDISQILNGDIFAQAEKMNAVFTGLLPQYNCPKAVCDKVYDFVRQVRLKPQWSTFPFDLVGDSRLIDSIISDDACSVEFNSDGQLCNVDQIPSLNLRNSSLEEILRQAFPKTKGATDL